MTAHSVACPTCRAEPGEECLVRSSGTAAYLPHRARRARVVALRVEMRRRSNR